MAAEVAAILTPSGFPGSTAIARWKEASAPAQFEIDLLLNPTHLSVGRRQVRVQR
jgi:hypothetical protein